MQVNLVKHRRQFVAILSRWTTVFHTIESALFKRDMTLGMLATRLAPKPIQSAAVRNVRASMTQVQAYSKTLQQQADGRLSIRWGTWRASAAQQQVTMKTRGGYSVQWLPPVF